MRYFDLNKNRTSSYQFSFDRMLENKGNTAVYMLYAYARIYQIIAKANKPLSSQSCRSAALRVCPGASVVHGQSLSAAGYLSVWLAGRLDTCLYVCTRVRA